MTTIHDLRLFMALTPFQDHSGAVLDRDGQWTEEMHEDFDAVDLPAWTGLAVWEGSTEQPEGVIGWSFEGEWRRPTPEEIVRLAEGIFPLRDRTIPLGPAHSGFEVIT